MHVGSRTKKIVYNVNDRDLSVVQTEKDLGVQLDYSLKPSNQCVVAARRGKLDFFKSYYIGSSSDPW